jgi:hypothetical protein
MRNENAPQERPWIVSPGCLLYAAHFAVIWWWQTIGWQTSAAMNPVLSPLPHDLAAFDPHADRFDEIDRWENEGGLLALSRRNHQAAVAAGGHVSILR